MFITDSLYFDMVDQIPLYEKKFSALLSVNIIDSQLRHHKLRFKPIYHTRRINNVYFDDINYSNYFDNVEGNLNRKKVRIRWYGDTFTDVINPVLEVKLKKGTLGKKVKFQI